MPTGLARIASVFPLLICSALCGAVPPQLPGAQDFRSIVQAAKDRVFPTVVYVRCLAETTDSGRRMTSAVTGSGVLISPRGELLTNWHVIDKAIEVRCLLHDGRAFPARVVGHDKSIDIALVQLEYPESEPSLPFAETGDSGALAEGDFVMSMGAPWGLNRSVAIGIISCTRRFLEEESEYSLWLQTDAPINPGNSGGPLVDTSGKVIGINTLGIGGAEGLGFAIPFATVRVDLGQIREHGAVRWTWFGLELQPLHDFNRNISFDATEGVIVAEVEPDSPAQRGGIQSRDRILSIEGIPVTAMTHEDLPEIRRRLALRPVDVPVVFEIDRTGRTEKLTVTPRAKGEVEGKEREFPRFDFALKEINQFDNEDLYFYQKEGVFIHGLRRPGNAASAGFSEKDILVRIGSREIRSMADAAAAHEEALRDIEAKPRVVVQVRRGPSIRQIVLEFSRDYSKK